MVLSDDGPKMSWCRLPGVNSKMAARYAEAEVVALLEDAEIILGSDEAGLGAWAGPCVVSAVLAPKGWTPRVALTDSKDMTDAKRRTAAKALLADERIFWQTLWTHAPEIDQENVYHSNIRMHTRAVEVGLAKAAELYPGKNVVAVVDGNLPIPRALSMPKADARVVVCSAASVLAKVARDTWMVDKMAKEYPGYAFESHKGYGGNEKHAHTIALEKLGPCAIHRKSFDPIARLLKRNEPNVLDLIALLDDDPV
jgi:ribonuclease HII